MGSLHVAAFGSLILRARHPLAAGHPALQTPMETVPLASLQPRLGERRGGVLAATLQVRFLYIFTLQTLCNGQDVQELREIMDSGTVCCCQQHLVGQLLVRVRHVPAQGLGATRQAPEPGFQCFWTL